MTANQTPHPPPPDLLRAEIGVSDPGGVGHSDHPMGPAGDLEVLRGAKRGWAKAGRGRKIATALVVLAAGTAAAQTLIQGLGLATPKAHPATTREDGAAAQGSPERAAAFADAVRAVEAVRAAAHPGHTPDTTRAAMQAAGNHLSAALESLIDACAHSPDEVRAQAAWTAGLRAYAAAVDLAAATTPDEMAAADDRVEAAVAAVRAAAGGMR